MPEKDKENEKGLSAPPAALKKEPEPKDETQPVEVEEKPEPEVVRFRAVKRRYTYWLAAPKQIRLNDGRLTHEGGTYVVAKDHLIEVPSDETFVNNKNETVRVVDQLRKSKRFGIDFIEIGSEPDQMHDMAMQMHALYEMDESEIRQKFTLEELTEIGLGTNAGKYELIAAFLKLKKQL